MARPRDNSARKSEMERRRRARQAEAWLRKKSRKPSGGRYVGSVAFYGPDNTRASKVVIGVMPRDGSDDDTILRKWFDDEGDIRRNPDVLIEVVEFLREWNVSQVAMTDGLLGCPHEEGIDYPEGEWCPECPYWRGRDRFTGKLLEE